MNLAEIIHASVLPGCIVLQVNVALRLNDVLLVDFDLQGDISVLSMKSAF